MLFDGTASVLSGLCCLKSQDGLVLKNLVEDIRVMPFENTVAVAHGPTRKTTCRSRMDYLEKLIPAHALSLNVTLVTNNLKHFGYPRVVVENWLIRIIGRI